MSALGHAMLQASCHAFFHFRVCHFDIHSNMFFSRFVMPNLTCQATTCFMSVMCVMKMLACQVLWHKFMLCPTQEMPKHKNDDEWAFQKKVKQVVKEILAEDESKNVSLQYVRTVVKEKLLKGDEPENLLKFNALVDSTVSHYQRKDREAASSSKPKHVVKPVLKK